MDIGKRIRQLRIQNDLTLEELASRTELTKGFLSQLERNLASPSIQTLEDITEALGTNMSKFFAEETEEQAMCWRERSICTAKASKKGMHSRREKISASAEKKHTGLKTKAVSRQLCCGSAHRRFSEKGEKKWLKN